MGKDMRHSVISNRQNNLISVERPRQASIQLSRCTCWYCNEPMNSVRRFCDKSCAEAFEEDDTAFERRAMTLRVERYPHVL